MIRKVLQHDAKNIADIYNYYIKHTVVTFEESLVSTLDMEERIKRVTQSGFPWLVAEDEGRIVGYAYAGAWNPRAAYRFSAETTVYLANDCREKGWGSQLYEALFAELRTVKAHIAIGGITLPNDASAALHEKFGMQKVAHFKEVGYKFGKWLDVGYWQVELDS